jgi:hypothetical protein
MIARVGIGVSLNFEFLFIIRAAMPLPGLSPRNTLSTHS